MSELILFMFFFFLIMLATLISSKTATGNIDSKRLDEMIGQLNYMGVYGQHMESRFSDLDEENRQLRTEKNKVVLDSLEQGEAYAAEIGDLLVGNDILTNQNEDLLSKNDLQASLLTFQNVRVSGLERSLDQLRQSLADENAKRLEAEDRFEKLRTALSDILVDLAFSTPFPQQGEGIAVSIRGLIEDKLSEISQLEEQLDRQRALADALQETVFDREGELISLRGENDEAKQRVEQLDGRLGELVSENSDLLGLLAQEQAKYDSLFASIYNEGNGLLTTAQADIARLEEQVARLLTELGESEEQLTKLREEAIVTRWPASLDLNDDEGYRFESGSYVPSQQFLDRFQERGVPELLSRLAELEGEISVIEVRGHTDEEFLGLGKTSNLDQELIDFMFTSSASNLDDWSELSAADNAGLGLARAVAISVLIRDIIALPYPDIKVLPFSAGQLIENGSQGSLLATPPVQDAEDRARRRIEIRFRG